MCGIAGYMGKVEDGVLQKMLQAIAHRGPDAKGYHKEKDVGLANNRLAIIDLSPLGKQPMFDAEKSVCVVYNGEIYNFQELRRQLEGKYAFRSKSDTEVLLYAYREWGIECVQKLNGMFSFVIYDRKKNLLFGARDRLGEKPLKYYVGQNIFAFASEIKALVPLVKNRLELDPIAIHHYLTLQYVPAPYTGCRNIFKLPPAHYFIYQNGKLQIKQYWDISFEEKLELSENDWEDLLLKKIKESVVSRMISDVPVGVFLSGGIDSGTVVSLAAKSTKNRLKTFSIGFDDPRFDESLYAERISKKYHTDHHSFQLTRKEMGNIFTHLADYYDEPFADNSAIPMIALAKLTSKYVKVALSGDGGDENFGGYDRYNIVSFEKVYKHIPLNVRKKITQLLSFQAASKIGKKVRDRSYIYSSTFDQPFYRKYLYYMCFFENKVKNSLYSSGFREFLKTTDTFDFFKNIFNKDLSDLDNALSIDIHSYLPEDLLFKADIASMAFSLESRAPFLNHDLVELCAKIPDGLKIKFFNKKYLLKKLIEDNSLLPDDLINRKKQGFISPIDGWLKNDYKKFVIDMLMSKKFTDTNIFSRRQIETYLLNYFKKNDISSNSVFALVALAQWIEKYN